MRRFYGVYLKSTAISTILDLVRFVGEPDSIRFSHITLRGPYEVGLGKNHLRQLNHAISDRTIRMLAAERFVSSRQSTAVITVDLLQLNHLVHKPDYPEGTPHITIYDGKDQDFCTEVYNLAREYNWENSLEVSSLMEITPKKKIEQEFLPFFDNFFRYFHALVGDSGLISKVRYMQDYERLSIIGYILERCAGKDSDSRRDASLGMGQKALAVRA